MLLDFLTIWKYSLGEPQAWEIFPDALSAADGTDEDVGDFALVNSACCQLVTQHDSTSTFRQVKRGKGKPTQFLSLPTSKMIWKWVQQLCFIICSFSLRSLRNLRYYLVSFSSLETLHLCSYFDWRMDALCSSSLVHTESYRCLNLSYNKRIMALQTYGDMGYDIFLKK